MKRLETSKMESLQGGYEKPSCTQVWLMTAVVLIGGIAPVGFSDVKRCWNQL